MKKQISFPSIEQFRNIIANINRQYSFVGLDDTGEAIYDYNRPKPVLRFVGTIKIHGTNFGVCFNDTDGIWAQSRESIITPDNDNAGAAFFMETNKAVFMDLFNSVKEKYNIDTANNTISIYAEWAGKGIQKGVGINNLPKSMFIIGLKISPFIMDSETPAYWLDSSFLKSPENNIFNIEDYKTYTIDIDFNAPQLSQNKILEMTLEVEEECPVAKAFGYCGIGEGLVVSHRNANGTVLRFKSKGLKHAGASKVKTLKHVDDEKINKIIDVVNEVCTHPRLEQMLDKTFDTLNGGKLDIKRLGEFIKNVLADITKEESDIIAESGLIPKDINSKVSEVSRNFYFTKANEEVGLK